MDCDEAKRRLHSYLDGELPASERDDLDRHVERCAECREALRQYAEDDAMFAISGRPRDGLAERVLERAKAEPARLRRTWLWWLAPLAVAAGILAAVVNQHVFTRDEPAPAKRHAVATLTACKGNVMTKTADDQEWRPASEGDDLATGDGLKIAEGALADIEFADRAKVKLNANAAARIDENGLLLESGRVFVWVQKARSEFAVDTRQAKAVVRGTQFNVDARSAERTILSVVEGVVDFGNQHGSVEAKAGMQSVARAGTRPDEAAYADLLGEVSWAGVDASTFEFPIGISLRVRPETPDAVFKADGVPPTFVVQLEYGKGPYAAFVLYCAATDIDGRSVAQLAERVCERRYRYKIKRIVIEGLKPGRYKANFRIGHGRHAAVETVPFSVRR